MKRSLVWTKIVSSLIVLATLLGYSLEMFDQIRHLLQIKLPMSERCDQPTGVLVTLKLIVFMFSEKHAEQVII